MKTSLRTSSMRMSSFNYMPRFGVDAADLHWLRLFPRQCQMRSSAPRASLTVICVSSVYRTSPCSAHAPPLVEIELRHAGVLGFSRLRGTAMSKVAQYLRAHWLGDLSLPISIFVNGLALYLALIFLLVPLGQVLNSSVFAYAGIAVFLIWIIWASVGIVRSAIRNYRLSEASLLRRTAAVGAITLVLIVWAVALRDLVFLFG